MTRNTGPTHASAVTNEKNNLLANIAVVIQFFCYKHWQISGLYFQDSEVPSRGRHDALDLWLAKSLQRVSLSNHPNYANSLFMSLHSLS